MEPVNSLRTQQARAYISQLEEMTNNLPPSGWKLIRLAEHARIPKDSGYFEAIIRGEVTSTHDLAGWLADRIAHLASARKRLHALIE